MTERWIEYVDIDTITPALLNPKLHDLNALRASVDVHGWTEPILIDERTGRLVSGHGRHEELVRRRDAGEDAPDGIRDVDGAWLAPVVRGWASKDDAHATSALLGANQITISAGWRQDEVAALLTALEENDPSLVLAAGFDEQALADAIAEADNGRMLETDDSDDFVTVTFRVPQQTADLLRAAIDTFDGTESEKIRQLAESVT